MIAICSTALNKPIVGSAALTIGGTLIKVDELANTLQVCLDSGVKKVLLPMTSAVDLGTLPAKLMGTFNLIFYQTAEDAVFKALDVE
jgi:ATP-dependent Lon protease